jgi:hypothetical protein
MEAAVEAVVMESIVMGPTVKATAAPSPAGRDWSSEGYGQYSHKRQAEDLLHDRLRWT